MKSLKWKLLLSLIIILTISFSAGIITFAEGETFDIPGIDIQINQPDTNQEVADSIKIIALLTILGLAPSILIMMTSFTRFIIVFSFLRKAMSLQSTPPNQVLVGLALFLTLFVMTPVITDVMENAFEPFSNGEISQEVAIENAQKPVKEFMLKQVRSKDLALFLKISNKEDIESLEDVPISSLIPAFIISELKTGFEIGFLLFIPFIVIDMIVASTLMALGMMMLPPVMISLPFKILLFVLVDGWHLIVEKLILSVR
ncbi:flagellar type III secretion system pore protein FliP [Clostridiaceae bacterium HSG29]|nr:flagellar type III secretion system pore protein FliP [Clostridiaceae bacterium HSG29]